MYFAYSHVMFCLWLKWVSGLAKVVLFGFRRGRPRDFFSGVIGDGRDQWLGGTMASAEHEPITGSGGRAPGQEVRGAKPPEAESILVIGCPTESANLAPFQKCICISTLGATAMIWEKFMSKSRGLRWPPCPFLGAPVVLGIWVFRNLKCGKVQIFATFFAEE